MEGFARILRRRVFCLDCASDRGGFQRQDSIRGRLRQRTAHCDRGVAWGQGDRFAGPRRKRLCNVCAQPNAHVVIGDLLHPPVRPIFDMAFSVGVLHHLPDPAAGFASLASRVRNGGRVFFWVYGYEGNEWITRYINPIRRAVTSKLPAGLLRVLCLAPSVFLWAVIKLFYRPGADGKGPKRLPYGDYFAAMYDYPFDEIHANVFDQLVTPVAFYLKEEEVRPWLSAGLQDILLRSHRGYSWTGLASVSRQ